MSASFCAPNAAKEKPDGREKPRSMGVAAPDGECRVAVGRELTLKGTCLRTSFEAQPRAPAR
jgi:hypothetical protein